MSNSDVDFQIQTFNEHYLSVLDKVAPTKTRLAPLLNPMMFALYMLPLGQIISNFKGISQHCYADDIQLHISFKPQNFSKLSVLLNLLLITDKT